MGNRLILIHNPLLSPLLYTLFHRILSLLGRWLKKAPLSKGKSESMNEAEIVVPSQTTLKLYKCVRIDSYT